MDRRVIFYIAIAVVGGISAAAGATVVLATLALALGLVGLLLLSRSPESPVDAWLRWVNVLLMGALMVATVPPVWLAVPAWVLLGFGALGAVFRFPYRVHGSLRESGVTGPR